MAPENIQFLMPAAAAAVFTTFHHHHWQPQRESLAGATHVTDCEESAVFGAVSENAGGGLPRALAVTRRRFGPMQHLQGHETDVMDRGAAL